MKPYGKSDSGETEGSHFLSVYHVSQMYIYPTVDHVSKYSILFGGFKLYLEQRKVVESFHLKVFVKVLLRANKNKKK